MSRAGLAFLAACCGVVLGGCGSASIVPRPAPVRLSLRGPIHRVTTLAESIAVRGTVSPAASTVLVGGRPATVTRGSFSAVVPLAPGNNVIDVLAGAPRSTGAMTAVRVYRELPVTVPDLSGMNPSNAVADLAGRGLKPRVVDVGSFFQSLIPTAREVCGTSPPAGRVLAPGTIVDVQVAKLC